MSPPFGGLRNDQGGLGSDPPKNATPTFKLNGLDVLRAGQLIKGSFWKLPVLDLLCLNVISLAG